MLRPFLTTTAVALHIGFGVSCAHDVVIDSSPPGAKVFVEGKPVDGTAPVTLHERPGFLESKTLRVELDGYEPLETSINQEECVWPVIIPSLVFAPCTFGLSCFGLRYATKYADAYEYRLSPTLSHGVPAPDPALDGRNEDEDENAKLPFRY